MKTETQTENCSQYKKVLETRITVISPKPFKDFIKTENLYGFCYEYRLTILIDTLDKVIAGTIIKKKVEEVIGKTINNFAYYFNIEECNVLNEDKRLISNII